MSDLLIFRLGASEWALPAHEVHQVLPPRPVTRVPEATPPLRGLVAWRARVLPVLALGERLGCDDPPIGRSALLVVEAEGETVALAVEEAVRFIQQDEVEGRSVQPLDLAQVLGEYE